ncbi:MAG TPA: hypothetical protein ENK54_05365 [Thiotrichales bacterium]|nr:hypothetical protein [Thiotrichales bacterium]
MQPVREVTFGGDGVIDACVEALCQAGCARVRQTIEALAAGAVVPGTEALNADQRRRVLEELESIMAVYDRPCPLP